MMDRQPTGYKIMADRAASGGRHAPSSSCWYFLCEGYGPLGPGRRSRSNPGPEIAAAYAARTLRRVC
jgi:hypothetical protein